MVKEEMLLKDISYLELWQPLCSVDQNHMCNFGRTILWYHFEFRPVDQEIFKEITYLMLWWPLCLAEWNHLCNFGRMYGGIALWNNFEFGPVVQEEMLFKDIPYLELWQPFCSAEQNHLCNFGRGYYEEQFCETILNLDQWLWSKKRLKIFLI